MARETVKLWYLERFKLFSELTPPEMEELDEITQMQEIPRSQVIYLPGSPAKTIYLVKKGKVRISRCSADGKSAVLAVLGSGDVFGEQALLDGEEYYDEVAEAFDKTVLCLIKREDFEELLLKKPKLNLRLTKLIGLRLKNFENQICNLLFKDAVERLKEVLEQFAKDYGVPHPEGTLIDFRLTAEELGYLVHTSRQTISAGLNELRKQGVLKKQGHKFILQKSFQKA